KLESAVANEGVKAPFSPISSPKGRNSIAGGSAPGRDRIDGQPCKGCISLGLCNPCRVGRTVVGSRGRCPRLLNLSPSGKRDVSDRLLTHPRQRRLKYAFYLQTRKGAD